MIRQTALLLQQARYKLKRLGLGLFYAYLLLVCLGVAGGAYTLVTLLQKCFLGASVLTRWWEIAAMALVSWATVKLFYREATRLLEADPAPPAQDVDYEAPVTPVEVETTSNVIPFQRKSSP